ncbi:MAG: acylphosphatase [Blautia sp.]|nr:acylphosphatase [Blautia sp.]
MKQLVRKHLFFSGRVQGVGFRYRALSIAREYHLTGFVKNLWDGRVQMQVQGEEDHIYAMITALGKQKFIEIEDMEMYDIPVDVGEQKFSVR